MSQVEMKRTPYSIAQLASALRSALETKLGDGLTRNLAEMLLATIMLETANGLAIYHNNVGNVTTSGATYWVAPKNPNHFAVYDTIESGISGYLYEILRRPTLVAAAKSGDPFSYAVQYRDTKYCPDCDPSRTTKTFQQLRDQVRKQALFADLPGPAPMSSSMPDPKAPSPSSSSSGLPGQSSTAQSAAIPKGVYVPAPPLPVLRRGHRGVAVTVWQYIVDADPDSSFGPLTEHATKTFQLRHGLASTGIVDAETWVRGIRNV